MDSFVPAFINEIEKLYKKKKIVVSFILSVLLALAGQLIITALPAGFGIRGAVSIDFTLLILSALFSFQFPLFTALIAIDIFTGEFSNNTIKLVLTRPVTRFKIYSAKICSVGVFVIMNILTVLILWLACGALFNENSMSLHSIFQVLTAYLVSFFPVMGFALLTVLISNFVKSSVGAFFLSILVFLLFEAVGIFYSQYSNILFTSLLNWYNFFINPDIPFTKILKQSMILLGYGLTLLGYGLTLFSAGFYYFDKKEI